MTTRNPLPAIVAALLLIFLIGVVLVASAAAAVAATPPAAAAAPTSAVRLRRFVLLAGVDDGGPTRTKLRYATSDARAMGRVLQTMGGVAPEDVVFVSTANRAAFDAAFTDIEQRLRAGTTPGVRRELLVYYSGHSDEDGLLVGRDRIGYDELRARVQRAPADLRVVILDSCASGAFTRRKGGVKRAPFLLDASSDMRGHAFLTSSAADERAQESDRISASYFTYYLVSGLRGAADMNQDRRVTLQEAYQFASQETLARTERSQAGPQHAAYEFDLAGTGDMVVTDVRGTQSGLVLTPELGGRITVRESSGALVAELRKPAGNTIELGLEPGAYVVAMDSGSTIFQANVDLTAGKHTPLAAAAFHATGPREVAVARGDAEPQAGEPTVTATATAAPPPLSEPMAYKLTFFPTSTDKQANVHGFSFGFVADRSQRVHGFQFGIVWAQTDVHLEALQLSAGANLVRGTFDGVQITGGLNIVRGTGRGLQLVGGSNVVDGTFDGTQIAGASNATTGYNKGVQIAGGVNWIGNGSGVQIAGGASISAKDFKGLQLSTLNYAGSVDGVQLGVVNVAPGTADGLRFGVVNVGGSTRGFSFGVVNFAKHEDGESFALINIVGNGIHDVSLFASDVLATNVGFKLGGRHLYTNIMAGYQPGDELSGPGPEQFTNGTKRFGIGFGLGWRFPIDRGVLKFAELEADSMQIRPVWHWIDDAPSVNSLRLQAGIKLAPYVTLLAGAGVNVAIANDGRDLELGLGSTQWKHDGGTNGTTVRIYPGLLLGLQI